MSLELKKFNMKEITFKPNENKGPVIVMIGRRDTGKSFLVRDLLYYHQDIPIGTVISGTEAGNGFYSEHVPKLFIHEEYSSILIENVLRRQKTVLKQMNKDIENLISKYEFMYNKYIIKNKSIKSLEKEKEKDIAIVQKSMKVFFPFILAYNVAQMGECDNSFL